MNKFIKKPAAELAEGDIIVMANTIKIHVRKVRVRGNVVMFENKQGELYTWPRTYECFTLNPRHPEYNSR